ncbi:MAG: ABC transporter substrate-binding protein [Acidimicrobiales bacterium]|nr:ABC transporter substrate-binding protein [Acidimicrobiales bacterium]
MQLKRSLAVATAAALFVACGDDAAESGSTTEPVAADDAPQSIVSLSPTTTEMLFAIGAGDQVVAVDEQSDFPEDVPVTDLSGYEPNVEAIASYEPDLVVASGLPEDAADGLDALDIEVLDVPAAVTLDDTYAQLAELGAATGHEDEAADVEESMRSDIDELVASVPERDAPVTYYHELDDTLYSATSSTFIGEVYGLAGLENVADAADPDGALGGYPQLSPEFLVDADPDVVFLADTECCGQDATTFAARPGFAELTAVSEGRIVELDEDVASRWGPRVVDFLRAIVDATADVTA